MNKDVLVKEVMKTKPVIVQPFTSVFEAACIMKQNKIGNVIISEVTHPIGILTESDIIKKVVCEGKNAQDLTVEEIMSSPIPGIEERRPLTEAADLIDRHRTLHLGVTKGGALVGLVSVRDFLRPVSIDEF